MYAPSSSSTAKQPATLALPQQVASKANSRERSKQLNKRIVEAYSWREIVELVRVTDLDIFDEVNCATAIHRIAKLARKARVQLTEAGLKRLLDLLETKVDKFKPQAVANTLWAYATMGLTPSSSTMAKLSSAVERLAIHFN